MRGNKGLKAWAVNIALVAVATAFCLWAVDLVILFTGLDVPPDFRDWARHARQQGIAFDGRSRLEVMDDLRAQGVMAYPMVSGSSLTRKRGLEPERHYDLFPLGGISRVTTLMTNELGQYPLYEADEHGFNNPAGRYVSGTADALLIGDSLTHGWNVPREQNMASNLERSGIRTMNLAMPGNGPLLELATLKEYGPIIKPRTVFWMLFEGNDVDDLLREQLYPDLTDYLRNGHTQQLVGRQAGIDTLLKDFAQRESGWARQEAEKEKYRKSIWQKLRRVVDFKHIKEFVKRFTEQARINLKSAPDLFSEVFVEAKRTTATWGGELVVVILPYHRWNFVGPADLPQYLEWRKVSILGALERAGVRYVDLYPDFQKAANRSALYPFGVGEHYTPEGNAFVAAKLRELAGK